MQQKNKSTKSKVKHWNNYGLLLIPGFGTLVLTLGGALFWNANISLNRWAGYENPVWVGFRNYRYLAQNEEFRGAVLHAAFFIIPFALIPTLIGALLAAVIFEYISPRFGERMGSFFRVSFYLPQVVPIAISGLLWLAILGNDGILNMALRSSGHESLVYEWLDNGRSAQLWMAVILVWLQLGYTTMVFVAGMARIDTRLYEAAQLDGASWLQQFRAITLPQLRPEMFVVLLITSIGALKIFAPIYWITSGGPFGATNVPSLYAFNAFYGGDQVPFGATVSTVFAVIVGTLAFLVVQLQHKYFGGDEA